MIRFIDTSRFDFGLYIDYDSEEEVETIRALTAEAKAYVGSYRWTPPIEKLMLAFGIGLIIGLDLMRFAPTEQHAQMLLNRIDFIRKEFIPQAP